MTRAHKIMCFLAALFASAAMAQVPIYTRPQGASSISGGSAPGGTNNSVPFINPAGSWNQDNPNFTYTVGTTTLAAPTVNATTKFVAADGLAATPAYVFNSDQTTGFFRCSSAIWCWTSASTGYLAVGANLLRINSGSNFGWASGDATTQNLDTILARDAADTIAQKRSTNAQVRRLYFSTTGPVYFQETARTAGVLFTGTGGAMQLSTAQTTVPTITTNGGTSPSCVGTDTAMVCTIGTSPPAAATFTVTFNGTWPAAPSCNAIRATAGATPLVQNVVVGTTTVQVNLSANLVASEKYNIQCFGVS